MKYVQGSFYKKKYIFFRVSLQFMYAKINKSWEMKLKAGTMCALMSKRAWIGPFALTGKSHIGLISLSLP